MKKITGILAVLAVLAGTILTASCDLYDQIKDYYEATYNTWYVYNKEVSVPVAGEDSNATDGMLNNAKVYVKFNPDDGLDVLVCTKQAQKISYLGGLYEVEGTVTTGGSKHYAPDATVNRGSWIAMIEAGNFKKETPPEINVSLDDLMNGNFNLKRILVKLLLGYLD